MSYLRLYVGTISVAVLSAALIDEQPKSMVVGIAMTFIWVALLDEIRS